MNISHGLQALRNLKAEHIEVGKALEGAVYPLDFLAFGILNRSLCLSFGFASLIEQRNLIAAAPMLRFQQDNVLRFYASMLVSDPHEFSRAVLRGKSIRDMNDSKGNRLTDAYLLRTFVADTRMNIDRSWFESVYKQTSGYVHFSDKHLHNCLKVSDAGEFQMKVSEVDQYVPESIYAEAIAAMTAATRLTVEVVSYWAGQKSRPLETVQ